MASALPAGTACPFPSLCSQEAATAPWAASLAPRQPQHLSGGFTMRLGTPKAPAAQAQAGVVLGERGRGSEVSVKWCQPRFGCSPEGTTVWGQDQEPGSGDTSHRGGSTARGGTAALYPLLRSPVPCTAL